MKINKGLKIEKNLEELKILRKIEERLKITQKKLNINSFENIFSWLKQTKQIHI